jgi:hypothetical protein
MQLLCYSIYLSDPSLCSISTIEWKSLYKHLQSEGRIWEFRDLFQQMIPTFGAAQVINMFLGSPQRQNPGGEIIDAFNRDWNTGEGDEVLSFALLDLSTTLALTFQSTGDLDSARQCIEDARRVATHLRIDNGENLKCRPYLRWIMAKILVEQYEVARIDSLLHFCDNLGGRSGAWRLPGRLFPSGGLPIYAPAHGHIPEWKPMPKGPSDGMENSIRTVMKSSEELGDLEFQASCLQWLIFLSENPQDLLSQLRDLWLSAPNLRRQRQTDLFRYFIANTPTAREQLRRDILVDGEFGSAGFSQYAQYRILSALAARRNEQELYTTRADEIEDELLKDYPMDLNKLTLATFEASLSPVIAEVVYPGTPIAKPHAGAGAGAVAAVRRETRQDERLNGFMRRKDVASFNTIEGQNDIHRHTSDNVQVLELDSGEKPAVTAAMSYDLTTGASPDAHVDDQNLLSHLESPKTAPSLAKSNLDKDPSENAETTLASTFYHIT